MSFLSVLKSIGHVLQVGVADAAPLAPVIGLIPTVGPIAETILSAITAIEGLIKNPGTGAQKKAVVVSIVNTVHPGLDQAKLSDMIDSVVGGLNALTTVLGGVPAPVVQAP